MQLWSSPQHVWVELHKYVLAGQQELQADGRLVAVGSEQTAPSSQQKLPHVTLVGLGHTAPAGMHAEPNEVAVSLMHFPPAGQQKVPHVMSGALQFGVSHTPPVHVCPDEQQTPLHGVWPKEQHVQALSHVTLEGNWHTPEQHFPFPQQTPPHSVVPMGQFSPTVSTRMVCTV